jgi:hypothetical protein
LTSFNCNVISLSSLQYLEKIIINDKSSFLNSHYNHLLIISGIQISNCLKGKKLIETIECYKNEMHLRELKDKVYIKRLGVTLKLLLCIANLINFG